MAWKEVGQDEFWAEDNGTYGPKLLVNLRPAKRYRITLEEETHECCEKWRRLTVGNDDYRDCSRWLRVKYDPACMAGLYGPVKFCPECGRKLEG